MDQKQLGILCILGASFFWSWEAILAKFAYESVDPIHLSAVRAVIVALLGLAYVVIRRAPLQIKKESVGPLLYLALVGSILADVLYFIALSHIPVVNVVLIGHLSPLFIILIGYFVLKEELTNLDYIAVTLLMVAGVLVSTGSVERLLSFQFGTIYDLLVLVTTVCYATTTIVMRKYLLALDAGTVVFYRFGFASILFIGYLLLTGQSLIPTPYEVAIGGLVGIGIILFYESIKRLKAAQVAGLELTTPLFSVILSIFLLKEQPLPLQLVGMALILTALYLISKKEN